MHPEAQKLADKLDNDKVYNDLMSFAREHIGRATHDSLLRFKWAEYKYHEGVVAVMFVLASLLAVVTLRIGLSPEDVAELVKARVITIREQDDEEDDDDED
jgi:hypothetical protein